MAKAPTMTLLSHNQIMKKKPAKLPAVKVGDYLAAVNRSFNDGYEKALLDLERDHFINYETVRNYLDAQKNRSKQI